MMRAVKEIHTNGLISDDELRRWELILQEEASHG